MVIAAERGAFQPVTRGGPFVREDRDDDEVMREATVRDEFENNFMWDEDDDDERGAGEPPRHAVFDPSSVSRGAPEFGP